MNENNNLINNILTKVSNNLMQKKEMQSPTELKKFSSNEEQEENVEIVFARFAMFYGLNWHPYAIPSHELYNSLVKEWAESLRDLSLIELDQGLRLTKQTCDFAPSIAKFLRLCYDFYSFDHAFDLINNFIREKYNNSIINQPQSHVYENILANNTAKDHVVSLTYARCAHYFRDNEMHQSELRKIVKEVYDKEIINFLGR